MVIMLYYSFYIVTSLSFHRVLDTLILVKVLAPLLDHNVHADADPALAVLFGERLGEQGAGLDAEAAGPWGARVDVPQGAERLVGLAGVAVARVRVHVGEAAARRAARYVQEGRVVEARRAGVQAHLLPLVLVVGRGAGYWRGCVSFRD